MPLVPSRPLILLTDKLSHLEHSDDLEDLDEPLQTLVDAAIDVADEWAFYPEGEFGSRWATVDDGTVERLGEALVKYQETVK